jgi:hypothetical protein
MLNLRQNSVVDEPCFANAAGNRKDCSMLYPVDFDERLSVGYGNILDLYPFTRF